MSPRNVRRAIHADQTGMLMRTLWGTTAVLGLAVLLTACVPPPETSTPATNNPSTTPNTTPTTGGGATTPTLPVPPTLPLSFKIKLNWTAPSTRADGSALPLSEISGYRVYYLLEGTDSSNDTTIAVNGGTTTTLNLTLTTAGSYTFAITTVDRNGLESKLSSAVSVPIN
jgi:hypothetical protein